MLCDPEIFAGRIHLTIEEHVQSSKTSNSYKQTAHTD